MDNESQRSVGYGFAGVESGQYRVQWMPCKTYPADDRRWNGRGR